MREERDASPKATERLGRLASKMRRRLLQSIFDFTLSLTMKPPSILLATGLLLLLCCCFRVTTCNSDAKRLYDDLMSSYNSLIRPVTNNSDSVRVKIALKLSQLIEVVSRKKGRLMSCV